MRRTDLSLTYILKFAAALAISVVWGLGAAYVEQSFDDGCSTDTECLRQCLRDLRPDENPEVCDY